MDRAVRPLPSSSLPNTRVRGQTSVGGRFGANILSLSVLKCDAVQIGLVAHGAPAIWRKHDPLIVSKWTDCRARVAFCRNARECENRFFCNDLFFARQLSHRLTPYRRLRSLRAPVHPINTSVAHPFPRGVPDER